MAGIRFVLALVALGVVTAHDHTFTSFASTVYTTAMKLLSLGETHMHEKEGNNEVDGQVAPHGNHRGNHHGHGDHHDDHHHGDHHDDHHHEHHHGEHHHEHHHGDHHHGDHHDDHHDHHHHEDHHSKDHHDHHHDEHKKAHECHEKCGQDTACHAKCPKPWAPMVKACKDLPALKKCHASCKDASCDKTCIKFDEEWMNHKFAKHPEHFMQMLEKKCPMVEKAHACHQACTPGDHDCHHKCPHWGHHDHHHGHDGDHRHGHDDDDHHDHHDHHDHDDHHNGHDDDEHKKAHECHEKCGKDAACHDKCRPPMVQAMVKACHDLPALKKCHATCKDASCDKTCTKFVPDEAGMNEKFAIHPERFMQMMEKKCPVVEKADACHKACTPGDHKCHHKCPHWGHHDHHHGPDEQHHDHHDHHDQDYHHDHHEHHDHDDDHHHGQDDDHPGHHEDHRKHWDKMHQKMRKSLECHVNCGKDAACNEKCPKPMAPFLKACNDLPAIKACHATCKDATCDKSCLKFEMAWMNKKFAEHPDQVLHKMEEKCPLMQKASACHQACDGGDRECHHKCHGLIHHGQAPMLTMPMPEDIEKVVCKIATQKEVEDKATSKICSKISEKFPNLKFSPSCEAVMEGLWDKVASMCPKGRASLLIVPTPEDIEKLVCKVATQKEVEDKATSAICAKISEKFSVPDCQGLLEKLWDRVVAMCPKGQREYPEKEEKQPEALPENAEIEEEPILI